MPRARVTIVTEFDLVKDHYRYNGDRALSDEEVEALTPQQMMELEKSYLEDGSSSLEELVANADTDFEDGVKWELVEDDGPE